MNGFNREIEVLTADGTTGYIDSDTVDYDNDFDLVGEKLNIHYKDENGNTCEKIDEIVEVF